MATKAVAYQEAMIDLVLQTALRADATNKIREITVNRKIEEEEKQNNGKITSKTGQRERRQDIRFNEYD